MNPVLTSGLIAVMNFSGADAAGNLKPLLSLSATIDDYADAYIAANNPGSLMLVQKVTQPVGQVKTVNITFNGVSQSGNVLPPKVQAFDLAGAAPPPQATQVQISNVIVRDTIGVTVPVDPGSGTVTLI